MTKDELIRLLTEGDLSGLPGNTPVVVSSEKGRHVGDASFSEAMMEWGIFLHTEEQRLAQEDSDDIPPASDESVYVIVVTPKG